MDVEWSLSGKLSSTANTTPSIGVITEVPVGTEISIPLSVLFPRCSPKVLDTRAFGSDVRSRQHMVGCAGSGWGADVPPPILDWPGTRGPLWVGRLPPGKQAVAQTEHSIRFPVTRVQCAGSASYEPMFRPTLRQLEFAVALARHRHFGKTAEVMHVSQPGLSGQIKELEERLGVLLFERDRRQVRVTTAGEEVVARAQEILRQVDELSLAASLFAGRVHGRMRLVAIPTMGPYLMPALTRAMKSRWPFVDLVLHEQRTAELLEDVRQGEMDRGLIALPTILESYTWMCWARSLSCWRHPKATSSRAPHQHPCQSFRTHQCYCSKKGTACATMPWQFVVLIEVSHSVKFTQPAFQHWRKWSLRAPASPCCRHRQFR